MSKRDLRVVTDLKFDELHEVFRLAEEMKKAPAAFAHSLQGLTMAMINEKQSLRTKVTFEAGVQQMGGYAVYLTNQDINLGKREPVKDIARNLSRWVDLIVARVYAQQSIMDLAKYADIPVINALSDEGHPCQAIADLFTLWEHRDRTSLEGVNLTFIGDGNNVCNSLILIAGLIGFHLTVCTPSGYEPNPTMTWQGREMSHDHGGAITFELDPVKAVENADAIYTDVWTSMGQEEETAVRKEKFRSYQVNEDLLSHAPDHTVIMHCLPAHRGEEITDGVLESDRSIVFDQAENRLHTQKALMKFLVDQSK